MSQAEISEPVDDAHEGQSPILELVPAARTEFGAQLGRALANGSDWVIDYRGGQGPRTYLKPEAVARYTLNVLRVVDGES